MSRRSRNWCWTVSNYTDAQRLFIDESTAPVAKYLCYQPEIAPTTGTPHLQGFVSFANPRTLAGVSQLFGTCRPHLEPAGGTADQAIAYCEKEESRDLTAAFGFCQFGERPSGPGQGSRTDLAEIGKRLRDGETIRTIAEDHPGDFIRYNRGLTAYAALFSKPRNFKTEVHWFHGATGGGKSHAARAEAGEGAFWKSMDSSKWWDGYDGVSPVVLDDYRCNFSTFTFLLRLFDEYPLQLEVKGGTVNFAAKKIYVTSPHPPTVMWSTREDLEQLTRRITEIRQIGELVPVPEPEPVAVVPNFFPN